ncbi:hypothetical protein LOK49_LG06G02275 [Camellia lanceoleosa]|uniref:Uncharacterized protein n=1 Tax=Camellia lanceoleosa TaxID=1840588 RepID=A0ACC0HCB2_9ERIC|nr:hypothetical protein LOK49_LG06G02275 [Camellia lanceoleosa]
MDSMSRTTIFVTIALSLFFHVPTPANSTRMPLNSTPYKLVNEFCNQAKNKTFCVETFKLDPRSALAPDQVTLVKVAIDLGISGVSKLKSHVSLVLPKAVQTLCKASSSKLRIFIDVASEFLRGGAQICVWPIDEDSYETASENILSELLCRKLSTRLDSKGFAIHQFQRRDIHITCHWVCFGITNNVPTPPLSNRSKFMLRSELLVCAQA